MAHAASPALDSDNGVALGKDTEVDGVLDTHLRRLSTSSCHETCLKSGFSRVSGMARHHGTGASSGRHGRCAKP